MSADLDVGIASDARHAGRKTGLDELIIPAAR
jgi:hypothetical protein